MPRRDLMLLVSRAPVGAGPGGPFAGTADAYARPARLPRPTGPDALPLRTGPHPDR